MKKGKKKYINYPKERAVLSDIHPYEVPITFRNRYFYRFLVENGVEINSNNHISNRSKFTNDELNAFNLVNNILFSFNFNSNTLRKIPFTFRISHKEKDFRELALIHPINQLKLVQFYDQYKESIIYSCSISNFSVRKPVNVAKFTFFNDKLHQKNKGDKNDFLDLYGKEYEDLKTFFSYEKYTNIYRFYEDYRYHRAEKKYNHLFKFDISKCFDSIYSHSISWAVLGLEAVKENIQASKNTFPGEFDKFIQLANHSETNGILIGPEFSRIFAEIILQRIDKNVELKLLSKQKINKVDYEIYRYVDDYFLFCDEKSLKDEILQLFKHELKNYKLAINDAKSKDYSKPIITEITLAKEKITKLFSKNPRFIIEKKEDKEDEAIINVLDHNFSFYFNADDLITQYKMIIKETNVEYKDVLNYSLALLSNIIEKNLINAQKIFSDYKKKVRSNEISDSLNKNRIAKVEDLLTSHLVNFIDFVFFIYSVSPRVNSTIKVCHILSKILLFYKQKVKINGKKEFLIDIGNRQRINKKILDECSLIIKKNSIGEYTQIETLYLFITIKELGKEFRLPNKLIEKFLDLNDKGEIPNKKLNYFSITVLLYYFGYSKNDLKTKLINYIKEYIHSFPFEIRSKSSELTHLILDLLACPFITKDDKKEMFFIYKNINDENEKTKYAPIFENLILFHKNYIKFWFTKWERFNFAKELDYKKSQEVYS